MHAAILLDEDRYARLEQLLDGGALPSRPPLGGDWCDVPRRWARRRWGGRRVLDFEPLPAVQLAVDRASRSSVCPRRYYGPETRL